MMKKRWIGVIILVVLVVMAVITYKVYSWSENQQKRNEVAFQTQLREVLSKNSKLKGRNKTTKNEVVKLRAEVENLKAEIEAFKDSTKKRKKQEIGRKAFAEMKQWAKRNGKEKTYKKVMKVYGGRIKLAAGKYGIDPRIIAAIITVESDGNPRAVSPSGRERGLMQLEQRTAWQLGVQDPFHPCKNILGGTKYFMLLVKQFGDHKIALAAYNLGPTKVKKYLKKGFKPQQYNYVVKVCLLARL
jgi:soluble lytic murein transglycosylase-like protein